MGKGIIAGGAGGGAEIPITSTPAENVDIWIDPNEEDQTSSFYTKKETNELIAAIPKPDVSGAIEEHNTSEEAHADIRTLISNLNTALSGKAAADLSNVEAAALLAAIEAAGGGAAKIETGTYTGTNGDTKSLTFGFVPKLVVIYGGLSSNKTLHSGVCAIVPCYGLTASLQNYGFLYMGTGMYGLMSTSNYYASLSGNTLTVGYNNNAELNKSSVTYRYMALG